MAGLECVAAILGIAGVGIQVSATLYDFAASASTAKDDMHMVAESIDTYSSVLETLGRQLEASQAVCSVEGLRLAQDLERQSEVLFKKIAENIPSSKSENVSMRQKMSWFFQKDRINFLVGQVEQLKATVSLLLQILILAQTSKPNKTETHNTTTHNVTNNVNINVNVVNAEISSQFRRAENRVMQYHNASVKFAKLQLEDDQPVVRNALPWQEEFEDLPVVRQTDNDDDIAANFGQLALRQPRISMADTNANSAQLVGVLLEHWTTIETHETSTTVETVETDDTQPSKSSSVNETTARTNTFVDDPISRTDTAPDIRQPQSQSQAPMTVTSTVTSTGFGNPIKGWWQKYRQSSKLSREEEERQRQLEKQENELKRRETQLQREQSLVERELKLQESEKQTEEAKAKALVERERRLAESQKLQETKQKQVLAEKELRLQAEQRQKEARKEHLARLKDIRHQTRNPGRKGSTKDGSGSTSNGTDSNGSGGDGIKTPSRVSTTSSFDSTDALNGSKSNATNTNTNPLTTTAIATNTYPNTDYQNKPITTLPPYLQLAPSSHLNNLLRGPGLLSRSQSTLSQQSQQSQSSQPNQTKHTHSPDSQADDPSPSQIQPLDRVHTTLREAKALRKQRREEWKQSRKSTK